MSWISAGLALGSAVLSASAAQSQADSQSDAATTEANAHSYQAELNRSLGENDILNIQSDTDNKVRVIARAATQMRGTQMAQQAASGVIVGDGSAGQMLDQTEQLSTEDTLATMYSGTNKIQSIRTNDRLQLEAAHNRSSALLKQADAAQEAGSMKAGAALLQGASSAYGSAKGFFKPSVPAARIPTFDGE